jgi:hypothetical protein
MRRLCSILSCAIMFVGVAASTVVLAQAQSDAVGLAARVAALEAKVAYLSDRQQIHDVYIHYGRGLDRNDVELMRTAFWPDVQINYGKQSNTFEEFVTRHLNWHVSNLAHYAHLITNESVEIAGDVAHVETYVTLFSGDKKDGKSIVINGRYIDRLDRRNGEWRIAVREFVPHFMTKMDTAIEAYWPKDYWLRTDCGWGTWDRRDPSNLRPLNRRTKKDVGPACAG